MIRGAVNSSLEGTLRITVRGLHGERRRVSAVIDTGYNGALTLPPAVIEELGLPWCDIGSVTLGDGSTCQCDIYAGVVIWDRKPVGVFIEECDTTPLVGMELLEGFKLTMDVERRGQVTIKPLHRPRRRPH
jgi:clan AA aspartic protease